MNEKVVLISCVCKKLDGAHPAYLLYISDWFRKAWKYAQCFGDQQFILSAEYGLINPNEIVENYEKTLNAMNVKERRAWADQVFLSLKKILKGDESVVFLAGQKYREFLIKRVESLGCKVEVPLEGLRIGEQKAWLKRKLSGNE
jgi:cytoplasmic iron level regulating protein YaaA (DUF328/UPF0246 family)